MKDPINNNYEASLSANPILLTKRQQRIYDAIVENVNTKSFASYVINGIPGSGKTEIYIKLIKLYIDMGKKSIVLLPEIMLATQITMKFKEQNRN